MDKAGCWFLLAKRVKNNCHRPASLLQTSLFHLSFSYVLLVKTSYLVSKQEENWLEMGQYSMIDCCLIFTKNKAIRTINDHSFIY